jgi:hypothetical protein
MLTTVCWMLLMGYSWGITVIVCFCVFNVYLDVLLISIDFDTLFLCFNILIVCLQILCLCSWLYRSLNILLFSLRSTRRLGILRSNFLLTSCKIRLFSLLYLFSTWWLLRILFEISWFIFHFLSLNSWVCIGRFHWNRIHRNWFHNSWLRNLFRWLSIWLCFYCILILDFCFLCLRFYLSMLFTF